MFLWAQNCRTRFFILISAKFDVLKCKNTLYWSTINCLAKNWTLYHKVFQCNKLAVFYFRSQIWQGSWIFCLFCDSNMFDEPALRIMIKLDI